MYAWAVALGGGLVAILGAIVEEAGSGVPFVALLAGPAIEEVLKPTGVLYLFRARPQLLRSRFHVALLAATAALVFATAENLIYVFLYAPDEGPEFAMYRFTVCTSLHVVCSSILGWGIGGQLAAVRRGGKRFELDDSLPWVGAAIALHALYNTVVYLLDKAEFPLY